MTLVAKQGNREIWAQFDQTAQVYELFFDNQGETFTGWNVDSLKDARAAAKHIFAEMLA
jgi:hypothetical protein